MGNGVSYQVSDLCMLARIKGEVLDIAGETLEDNLCTKQRTAQRLLKLAQYIVEQEVGMLAAIDT